MFDHKHTQDVTDAQSVKAAQQGGRFSRRQVLAGAATLIGAAAIPKVAYSAAQQLSKAEERQIMLNIMEHSTPAHPNLIGASMNRIAGHLMSAERRMWPATSSPDRDVITPADLIVPGEVSQNDPRYWLENRMLTIANKKSYIQTLFPQNSVGVTPPQQGSGIWHYALSLGDNHEKEYFKNRYLEKTPWFNWTTEHHLLAALFGGITGNPDDAVPLINGSYRNMPEVKQKVNKWKVHPILSQYSEDSLSTAAYIINTASPNINISDKELTALTLGALSVFYNARKDYSKSNIIIGAVNTTLIQKKGIPNYAHVERNNAYFPIDINFAFRRY